LVEPGFDAARPDDVGGQIVPLVVDLDLSDIALRDEFVVISVDLR
jgi:hypothetical protein